MIDDLIDILRNLVALNGLQVDVKVMDERYRKAEELLEAYDLKGLDERRKRGRELLKAFFEWRKNQ